MKKISLENVEATLINQQVESDKVQKIMFALKKEIEELQKENENVATKQKWEHIIILNDPTGSLNNSSEYTGWVVQQHEGEDAEKILSKLKESVGVHNTTVKKKNLIITSILDTFAHLKSKFTKEISSNCCICIKIPGTKYLISICRSDIISC
jgi:hypothetical protein